MSKKAELVGSHFPTIYLTIISLLQGIALSQLIPNLLNYLKLADNPWANVQLVPLVLMFLVIFIVWHHYAIGIFFLRWFPNIMDTIIPFIISIGQFYLMSFLDVKTSINDINTVAWTMGYAMVLIIGSFAYFSASWRVDATLFTNLMSLEHGIIHRDLTKKYFLFAGFSIFCQGVFALMLWMMHRTDWLLVSLVLLVAHLVVFEIVLLQSIRPHFEHALDEFEEDENKN